MVQASTSAIDNVALRTRIADYLRDAVVELEVWRQNARTAEERQALHHVTALLSQASNELRMHDPASDSAPRDLHLSEAMAS